MKQITYELFRINPTCKVKFSLVIKNGDDSDGLFNDNVVGKINNSSVMNKYDINGNEYYKFIPYPRVIIDIKPYNIKGEDYSLNYAVSFNRFELFWFMKKLSKFYNNFDVSGLFYVNNENELKVNYEIVKQNNLVLRHVAGGGSKNIEMNYIVYKPLNDKNELSNILYDGCIFSINRNEFYTCLSKDEVGFLLYELNKIDINVLSAIAINTYISLYKNVKGEQPAKIELPSVSELEEDEIIDIVPFKKDISIIPDI